MGEYKFKQKMLRIRYSTWVKIRRAFPSFPNESAAEYMERLFKEVLK